MKHRIAILAFVSMVTACAGTISKNMLRESAFIRAGSVNFWSLTSGGGAVSLLAIDGVAAKEVNGLVHVSPGKHRITMACSGGRRQFDLVFKAGEIYEYAYGMDQKGCFGGLIKVN